MPTGVYTRTNKHSFNRGRKHINRKKKETKGLTPINKVCLFCKEEFITNCLQPRKKFCSRSCNSKSRPSLNLRNLEKRDKEKQRIAVSSRIGEKHPLWIKDRSLLKDDSKERGGQLHREWSKQVKKRDGWECRLADTECLGRIESHHIYSWKMFPKLRYEIENGISLCHFHHPRKEQDEIRLIPTFKELLKKV